MCRIVWWASWHRIRRRRLQKIMCGPAAIRRFKVGFIGKSKGRERKSHERKSKEKDFRGYTDDDTAPVFERLSLLGEVAHEWAGAGLLVLFIIHNILNRSCYRRIFKGKYTPARIVLLTTDLLLLAVMLIQMYSGIVLSRHVFEFLPAESGLGLARRLHILGAYWRFLLVGFHLGLHWNMAAGAVCSRLASGEEEGRTAGLLYRYSGDDRRIRNLRLFKRDFPVYLFLRSEFVFLDFSEPLALFYLDYLALMGLCIFVAHFGRKLWSKDSGKN